MSRTPMLALSAQDHRFAAALSTRVNAKELSFILPSSLVPNDENKPTFTPARSQGLRCVLFAQPVLADVTARLGDGGGILGFNYAVVLVDFAWCVPRNPPATGSDNQDGSQASQTERWAELATTLRLGAEEALTALTELSMAHLVLT